MSGTESLDFGNGLFMVFGGDPHIEIHSADLYAAGGKNCLSRLGENSFYFCMEATQHPLEVNQVCWPWALEVKHGVWCVSNAKNGDLRIFKHGVDIYNCSHLNPTIVAKINSWDKMIRGSVDKINVEEIPERTLCDGCLNFMTNHLLEHIARGEYSMYLLKSLIGYDKTKPWNKATKEMLVFVLKHLLATPKMGHVVTFALPPALHEWTENIAWPTAASGWLPHGLQS